MAHFALPDVDVGECCPTCKRPLRTPVFGGVVEESYKTGLLGRAIDPTEVRGPAIDEATS